MLGHLYDRALGGERCWIRHDDGEIRALPTHRWLGARCRADGEPVDTLDEVFDEAVTQMCDGPTIELGCGPGRLVARLFERGIFALGIDRSAAAIRLAGRGGAPALLGDVSSRCQAWVGGRRCCWSTATSAWVGIRAGSSGERPSCCGAVGAAWPSSTWTPSGSAPAGCVWNPPLTWDRGSDGHR